MDQPNEIILADHVDMFLVAKFYGEETERAKRRAKANCAADLAPVWVMLSK